MRLIDADALLKEMVGITDGWLKPPKNWKWYEDSVRNAPTVDGWTSVKDSLPKKKGDYLIYNTDGIVWPYWYNPENKKWYDNCGYLTESVTHWMPLPKPPKGR